MSKLLKPCPFCGHVPNAHRNGAEGLYIFCSNDDCPQPEIEGLDENDDERVISLWNTRTV